MRGILFDMDGVLYNSDRPIAAAAETVRWVQRQAILHLFVTNTTSRDRNALVEKVSGFGIEASEEEIFTPAAAAWEWQRRSCDGPLALFLRPATRREFAGLPCLDDDAEEGAAYVIIGDLGNLWDYRTLNRAFRLLYHNRRRS
jgi:ribonucleotide monophosphatase NagD (HAD superfamily)